MKRKYSLLTICLSILAFSVSINVNAQSKVVVIPMLSDAESLEYVVTVAKRGGDFTDPVAAINSIIDASASKPYLIVIAPGIYDIDNPLVMKDYVSISGSGKESTVLRGSFGKPLGGGAGAMVTAANHTELSDLTIENTSNANDSSSYGLDIGSLVAISIYRSKIVVKNAGTSFSIGIYLDGESTLRLSDSEVYVEPRSSQSSAYAIFTGDIFSSYSIDNSKIETVSKGSVDSRALSVGSGVFRIQDSELVGDIVHGATVVDSSMQISNSRISSNSILSASEDGGKANTYISDSLILNNNTQISTIGSVNPLNYCDFVFKGTTELDDNCQSQ